MTAPYVGASAASQCEGKHRFESAWLAHAVNRRRARRDKHGDVYRCPVCNFWHLGQRQKGKTWKQRMLMT